MASFSFIQPSNYITFNRDQAILNVERNVREEEEEETNYIVGRGKYSNIQAPEWLDDS